MARAFSSLCLAPEKIPWENLWEGSGKPQYWAALMLPRRDTPTMSLSPSPWGQQALPQGTLLSPSRSTSNPLSKSHGFPCFLYKNHWLFNTSPPIKASCQVFVCWCADFCFPGGNLGVCLAWHMLFPAENSVSCQSKVGETWEKKHVTSCRLYVTALPGTKEKKNNPMLPSYSLGRASLLAVKHRSVKHVVISI